MNRLAIYALVPAALIAILCVIMPPLHVLANFSWFIGVGLGAAFYRLLARPAPAGSPMPAPATS